MAVTYTTMQDRRGETYTTSTQPTSTQVTAFISVADTVYEAETGSAPDHSDAQQAEIIQQITDQLIDRYVWRQQLLSDNPPQRGCPPILTNEIIRLMEKDDASYNKDRQQKFYVEVD